MAISADKMNRKAENMFYHFNCIVPVETLFLPPDGSSKSSVVAPTSLSPSYKHSKG